MAAGSSIGTIYKMTTWGESHGKAIGVVVDGCPAGLELCEADIQKRLAIAQSEMQERVNYDFIIVNDELEKAVGDAYEIIKNHTK